MTLIPGGRPNIVVVLSDDQTFGWIDSQTMPAFVARMASEDNWFDLPNMLASTPWCGPARANLFTGQRCDHNDVNINNQAQGMRENETVYNAFYEDGGIRTGIFGKWINGFLGNYTPIGWHDLWIAWNVSGDNAGYVDYPAKVTDGSNVYYDGNDPDNYSTDVNFYKAVEFVNNHASPTGDPFFLWVAPESPHGAPIPAARHAAAVVGLPPARPSDYQADVSTQPAWIQAISPSSASQNAGKTEARRCMLAMDEGMDDLIGALEDAGVWDNTLFVYLADNGNHWSRFGRLGVAASRSKFSPYPEVNRVSCKIHWPGVAGRTILNVGSTIDLTATFYDLMGVDPPVVLDGVSLVPLIHNVGPWKTQIETTLTAASGGIPAWWSLREYDPSLQSSGVCHTYTLYPTSGDTELYLDDDYDATVNKTTDPAHAELKARLVAGLATRRTGSGLTGKTEGQRIAEARPRMKLANGSISQVPLKVVYNTEVGLVPVETITRAG